MRSYLWVDGCVVPLLAMARVMVSHQTCLTGAASIQCGATDENKVML